MKYLGVCHHPEQEESDAIRWGLRLFDAYERYTSPAPHGSIDDQIRSDLI